MIENKPQWKPTGYTTASFGTTTPFYDPTVPASISRANASYDGGYSFIPSAQAAYDKFVNVWGQTP